jgi:hypothetical protein
VFTDLAVPGWTSHVLVASFFGAVNALGISILGEYVVRIYDQVRRRPMYLVDRVVNVPQSSWPGAPLVSRNADDAYDDMLDDAEQLVEMADLSASGPVDRSSSSPGAES